VLPNQRFAICQTHLHDFGQRFSGAIQQNLIWIQLEPIEAGAKRGILDMPKQSDRTKIAGSPINVELKVERTNSWDRTQK
jgi:hypothetical protein